MSSSFSEKMSTEPTVQEKKRFSIVHKPFALGKVNLFNPPKKNPNGHVASARIWDEDLPGGSGLGIFDSLEDFEKEGIDNFEKLEERPLERSVNKSSYWLNSWKITACAIVILGNVTALSILSWHRDKSANVAAEVTSKASVYTSGKTDLAKQEFQKLNLQSLKNIDPQSQDLLAQKTIDRASLPLAIPPANIPKDVIFSQSQVAKKYYYILADYTGEKSLELAKSKVPNVSLVNFPQGVFIYMGAFVKKESALKFIDSLKESGLASRIYPLE